MKSRSAVHSTEGVATTHVATETAAAVTSETSVATTAEAVAATVLGEGRGQRQCKNDRRSGKQATHTHYYKPVWQSENRNCALISSSLPWPSWELLSSAGVLLAYLPEGSDDARL